MKTDTERITMLERAVVWIAAFLAAVIVFLFATPARGLTPCALSLTGEPTCPQPIVAKPYLGPVTGATTTGNMVNGVLSAFQSYGGRVLTLASARRDTTAGLIFDVTAVDSLGNLIVMIRLRTVQTRTAVTIITPVQTTYLGYADTANPTQTNVVMKALGLDPRISPFQRLPIRFPTPELGGAVVWFSDLQYAFSGGQWNASSGCNSATLAAAGAASGWLLATSKAAAVQAASGPVAAIPYYLAAATAYGLYVEARNQQNEVCGAP